MNSKLNSLYVLLTVLIIVFTISLVSIKYVEDFLKDKDKKGFLDKYVSFYLKNKRK